jgi:hypothetical protein
MVSPLKPGFDEHTEFILPPGPSPHPFVYTGGVTSWFSPLQAGYYQVNARFEIPIDSTGWYWELIEKMYPPPPDRVNNNRLPTAPFPILLSIGIFVNGNLYAQGNNFQLNSEYWSYPVPGGEPEQNFEAFWYMNAPNVSDVVYLNGGQTEIVEICLLLVGLDGQNAWYVPFPLWITGDDHGVFTWVSIHKLS